MGFFDFILAKKNTDSFARDMQGNRKGEINYPKISEKLIYYNPKSVDKDGFTPLMYAFKYNKDKYKKLNLTSEEINNLINNSDLKAVNKDGFTPLMYALMYNKEKGLNLTNEQLNNLINNSDLKAVNKDGFTPLMYALMYNKEKGLNLTEEQLSYLINNSDLKQVDKDGNSPLMYALRYNKEEGLNLTNEQLNNLINNSDLKAVNKVGFTPLMLALRYNKEEGLNLTNEQITYLIENSDLKAVNSDGWTALMFVLLNNTKNELNLTNEQLSYLINNTDLNAFAKEDGWSLLMCALRYNKEEGLNLTNEQISYLINNSDLNVVDKNGWTALMFAFRHNKEEELKLTEEQLRYLIEKTDEQTLQKKVDNWGADCLLCLLDEDSYQKDLFISDNNFNLLLSKSNLSFKNANSKGQNWITLYLKADKKRRLPSNDYILSKIFEESVKNQQFLYYVIENFFEKNEERLFCLKEKHFDFLISKLDLNCQKSDDLLIRYIYQKDAQKLQLSENSLIKLIMNISYKNEKCLSLILEGGLDLTSEQWKIFIENMPKELINFSTLKKLNELKEKKFNIEEDIIDSFKLKIDIPSIEIIDILIDKVKGTNKVDLSGYDSDRDLFFKILLFNLEKLVKEKNSILKNSVNNLNQEEKENLINLVKKLNEDVGKDLENLFKINNTKPLETKDIQSNVSQVVLKNKKNISQIKIENQLIFK